jgi:hypothetical protein
VEHIAVRECDFLASAYRIYDMGCFFADGGVPTEASIWVARVVEAGSVWKHRSALIHLHTICLEDAEETW